MEIVTILWSFCAAIALMLAALFALLWLIERRDSASLMLSLLGAGAVWSACIELGLMHAATPAQYGAWLHWYSLSAFVGFVGALLFVRHYLGTGRLWLLFVILGARSIMIGINFFVHPSFNFSEIVNLRHVSLFGEQVAIIGVAVARPWQPFAVTSLALMIAYLIDATLQRWRKGGSDSRRKAVAITLGFTVPMLGNFVYAQLIVFGVLHAPLSNLPWFLGALIVMGYELGREVLQSRRARLELAELRGRLAQAERVSALGQLASTLAHELTQPLAATSMNVDAALIQLRGQADLNELRSTLDDIRRDTRRAGEMIARMRQLFKRRAIDMQPLSVEEVVNDVVSLVHQEATSRQALLSLALQPGLPRVSGDRVHLSQVLLNLLMNSIHAVESRPLDARRIVVEARAGDANGEVEIAVRDSGPGIPEDMAGEVFKPFFTTKSDGMGMGLALSRTIIEAHGGRLWSDRGTEHDGAIFRFTLRRAESPPRELGTAPLNVPFRAGERAPG